MRHVTFICLFSSLLIADNSYCNLSDTRYNLTNIYSRDFYNIGDTVSEEDQAYPHIVCHSDGYYNAGSTFRLTDYSEDIILISMNATW